MSSSLSKKFTNLKKNTINLTNLGSRIAKARRNNNQDWLAYSIEVSRQTISNWENEVTTPSTSNLIAIAQITGCNEDWLLTGEGEPFPNDLPAPVPSVDNDGYYPGLAEFFADRKLCDRLKMNSGEILILLNARSPFDGFKPNKDYFVTLLKMLRTTNQKE